MKVMYIRVSTKDQHIDRQMIELEKDGIEKVFIDKYTGKTKDRPQFNEMMNFLREGDTVVVHSFDRLSRSTEDLLYIANELNNKGVTLISKKEQLDTNTPQGKMMLTVIGAINEFEVAIKKERQLEGIAIAKQKGVYKGRKPIERNEELFNNLFEQYKNKQISKSEFAREMNISRPTLDKWLKEIA